MVINFNVILESTKNDKNYDKVINSPIDRTKQQNIKIIFKQITIKKTTHY